MKKKLLNPYKWKKRMKRGVETSQHSVGIDERLNLRLSMDQSARWSRNPYEHGGSNLKSKVEIIVLVVTVLTIFLLCFFHPYFSISTLSLQGMERISNKSLHNSVDQILSGKKYLVFSKKNYFALNVSELRDELNKKYAFENILIQKKFPHTILIEVKEKPPIFIYDDGVQYTLIGEQGEKLEVFRAVDEVEWHSVTKTVSSTNEQGEIDIRQEVVSRNHVPDTKRLVVAGKTYPVLYNSHEADVPNQNIQFSQAVVQGIKKWNEFLQTKNIHISYIELLDGGEEGYIHTNVHWGMYVKFADADIAFPVFLSILPKINNASTQYLDMRYLSRVYWK